MFYKNLFLLFLLNISLFAAGCGSSASTEFVILGKSISSAGYEITIPNYYIDNSAVYGGRADDGWQWVSVYLSVKNVSAEGLFSVSDIRLHTEDGAFEAHSSSTRTPCLHSSLYSEMAVDEIVSGYMTFSVPCAENMEIVFSPSPYVSGDGDIISPEAVSVSLE